MSIGLEWRWSGRICIPDLRMFLCYQDVGRNTVKRVGGWMGLVSTMVKCEFWKHGAHIAGGTNTFLLIHHHAEQADTPRVIPDI